jgi:hypothetical protein
LQVSVEGEPAEPLTPKLRGQIILWSVAPHAEGVAVSLEAAERAHFLRTCDDVSLIWLAAIFAAALFWVPRSELVVCIVIVLVILGALLLIALQLSGRWREGAQMFASTMPAPQTRVRIDETGLTLGSTTTPWGSLKAVGLNLRKARRAYRQYFRRYYVDRLLLDTAHGRVTLDAAAITQGQKIVDTIFNRLSSPD